MKIWKSPEMFAIEGREGDVATPSEEDGVVGVNEIDIALGRHWRDRRG
ncbi:MAG TPA: hypothetical protein VGG20_09175 [Thermoanaerobaculia bacterium]|jgi:hypothetical protein